MTGTRRTASWETSLTCQWGTPRDFYEKLNWEFRFTMDACGTGGRGMHDRTLDFGGLAAAWGGSVWCNPPYGRELGRWVAKAAGHAERGEATSVLLVPSRTDAAWWHDHAMRLAEIRFVRGRLYFVRGDGKPGRAPFPSAVLVFRARS